MRTDDLTDTLILILGRDRDASAANARLVEAIPDPGRQDAYFRENDDMFDLSEPHQNHDEGAVRSIDAAPAILGLREAGWQRYRELTGEDAPGLD